MENNSPARKQLPAFVILGIIALIAALVLAVTNVITRGPIAEHQMAALKEAFDAVMPADSYEEITVPGTYDVSSLYAAKSGDEIIGYCVTAVGKGYNGDVAVTLGVGLDGLLTGAAVGDTSFAETPGFGARAKEPAFQEQFIGLDAVNGGSFEALSGATVTSTAVLNAVNKALVCVDEVALNQQPASDPLVAFGAPAEREQVELTGAVLEGSAKGFQSDVSVQVTLDADGAVSGLVIDSSGETEGIGQRLMTEPFDEQFIGQAGPFAIGENVDALSGATVTSKAVVEAVNAALTAPTSTGDAVTGTAQGFQSEVAVTLTVADGAVASLEVDSSGETEGIGTRVGSDADFIAQFVGQTGPFTVGGNVNAVSGATVTSKAVAEAVNGLLAAASSGAAELPVTAIASNDGAELGLRADGAAVVVPVEGYTGELPITLNIENGQVVSGAFVEPEEETEEAATDALTGSKKGFESTVTVTVTLNEDGTIATLAVDASGETEGLGQDAMKEKFTSQFIGKSAPFALGEGIDAVASATITSKAVVDILNELVPAVETEEATDVLTGSKKGFESTVTVTITLNEDGTIATLAVDASGETEGLGQEAMKEKFTSQFIGKAAPFVLGEGIDAVASATITSKAVVDILNELVPAVETEEATDALTGSKKGFESTVTVTITLNEDGTIATLAVDASGETEGLGQEAMKEKFTSQFIGKAAPFVLGEGIDAVASATITSKAIVDILNEIVPAVETEEATDALTGSKKGFESTVTVTVTLNEDGTIATLAVDASGETEGLGQEAMKEKFTSQFIGKAAPFALGEGIDAVASATITSKAVVDILNELVPAVETEEATDALTGSKKGFESTVSVTVTLNEDGTIATLDVDASGETEGLGQEAMKEKFTSQFIGKSAPFALGEGIDAVASATITSKAVVDILNELVPAVETEEATDALTGSKKGFESTVTVTVTLNEDGTIATLDVDASGETEGLGQDAMKEKFTSQFIGKSAPFALGEGIDAVASATITSKAVVDILNELLAGE